MELTKEQRKLAAMVRLEVTDMMQQKYGNASNVTSPSNKAHDFLMGAATALHAVDQLVWDNRDDVMRVFPPLWYVFGVRDMKVDEFAEKSKEMEASIISQCR